MPKAHRAKRGAAYTIAEECERLFCETLRATFLGERNAALQDSLVMGARFDIDAGQPRLGALDGLYGMTPPADKLEYFRRAKAPDVSQFVEVFDYTGGARFRGFTTDDPGGDSTFFVFFDNSIVGKDLKQGYAHPFTPALLTYTDSWQSWNLHQFHRLTATKFSYVWTARLARQKLRDLCAILAGLALS